MNTKSIIEIFRGDDSDALGYQTIVGTINTDLDLTGCKAVFRYLGFFQEFDPIPEDGKLTIVIPSASSMQFPPGFGYASLKVYDIDRKVRTFTNRIPVFVKTMTPCRGGGEFDVEFSPFPELAPLKIFKGPNADDFDLYTGFLTKTIDRASAQKYGLSMLFDAMDAEKTAEGGCAASPAAIKAAYDAIIGVLADNYYTAEQTDEAIDRVAAYYITYDAAGNPFPTYASLANAQTVYSGGSVRVPTRNDYCVVLADEMHQGAEYRYIYAVAEGQTTGSWQPQFPVEGVMTIDSTVTKNSQNPVASSGIWSAIWGALSALPAGFTSLYDWCVSQLAGKASTADATLTPIYSQTPTFSSWQFSATGGLPIVEPSVGYSSGTWTFYQIGEVVATCEGDWDAVSLEFSLYPYVVTATRTRTDIIGYRLGPDEQTNPNRDKPLASETEAEALRTGKLDKSAVVAPSTSASDSGKAADAKATGDALAGKLDKSGGTVAGSDDDQMGIVLGRMDGYPYMIVTDGASSIGFSAATMSIVTQNGSYSLPLSSGNLARADDNPTEGNLAALDASGNPTDSHIPAANVALKGDLPYDLGTPIVIDTASSETVEGETVYYGAATLDNRTANIVQVTTQLDELRITFPAATSGKVRDFGLRVEVGTGSAALTAPALVPIAPTGETIKIENADGTIPALADGTATAKGVTLLYFSENAPGVFVVKGEQVEEVA